MCILCLSSDVNWNARTGTKKRQSEKIREKLADEKPSEAGVYDRTGEDNRGSLGQLGGCH